MEINKENLINECYARSIALLQKNACRYGFLASSPQPRAVKRNYLSIFARDSALCSLGALASQDDKLIATARQSILTLARNQAGNGQIPNYVKPEEKKVDFWRLGCIDATLWWLIIVELYHRYSGDTELKKGLAENIKKALFWLECQEHPHARLLSQGEASDWADLMPRSGRVLYSNALWYFVKQLYGYKNIKETKKNFDDVFYPFKADISKVIRTGITTAVEIKKKEKRNSAFLSYVGYLYWGRDLDVFGNSLALLCGLADEGLKKKIINTILSKSRKKSLPMPVLFHPISEKSKEWRQYMESYNQNHPYQYHNGGSWPFTACFWVVALAKAGKKKEAEAELARIAAANQRNDWEFNEWFHAKTGEALGMKQQSWNAGMFVFACQYLRNGIELF